MEQVKAPTLFDWITDQVETVPIKEMMKVRLPKSWKPKDVKDEIFTIYCPKCNHNVDGINCGKDEKCPW